MPVWALAKEGRSVDHNLIISSKHLSQIANLVEFQLIQNLEINLSQRPHISTHGTQFALNHVGSRHDHIG